MIMSVSVLYSDNICFSTTFWERAVHSTVCFPFLCDLLIRDIIFFFSCWFRGQILVLIVPVLGHCLYFPI